MIKVLELVIRTAAAAAILTIAFLLIELISGADKFQGSIDGWAWVIFVLFCLVLSFVKAFLTIAYRSIFKGTGFILPSAAAEFLNSVICVLGGAFAFFATAAVVPNLASYSSAGLIVISAFIIGVALATFELVDGKVQKVFNFSQLNNLT